MWRNIHVYFLGGSSNIVKCGGFKSFIRYPKCEDDRKLLKHCADWEEALTKYGGSLRNDSESLRTMFLAIIPKAIEDQLLLKINE